MLYHPTVAADHLAYLADIRESIHLRALGRQNPLRRVSLMAVDGSRRQPTPSRRDNRQERPTTSRADLSKLASADVDMDLIYHDNPPSDLSSLLTSSARVFRQFSVPAATPLRNFAENRSGVTLAARVPPQPAAFLARHRHARLNPFAPQPPFRRASSPG